MRRSYNKYLIVCAAAVMSLSLAACGAGGNGNNTQPESVTERLAESGKDELKTSDAAEGSMAGHAETEEEVEAEPETKAKAGPETKAAKDEMADTEHQRKQAAEAEDALPGKQGTSLPNPIQNVDSTKEFSALGLTLELPENEDWYSDVSYTIIAGKVAQISFYDKVAESDALARAGADSEGDISGVYYKFDDKKKESWSTKAEDGTQIDITLQVTESNSDVHGVLATWTYKGTCYSLWEDDAWEQTDAVAKMAIEIAKCSE